MDPVSIAAATVAALSPYLVKVGEKFATAAGDAAFKKAGELYASLTQRLSGKPAAHEALQDLAKEPEDADNAAALRKELKKLLAEDEGLMRDLAAILGPVAAGGAVFNNQIAGNVGTINQVGSAADVIIGGTKNG
ncbi:MAG: hypothetical protein JWN23_2690 [Rhodocyclales bacterium]|nr:hypothetical protein [Rhodocyclales bacterium]